MAIVATGEKNPRLNFLEIESHPLFTLMQTQDAATKQRVLSLKDFDDRVWVLFGKHVHPRMHDSLLSRAEELGVAPSEIQHFTTAEEAAYLVAKHQGIAILNRTSAWRVAINGLTMRPLEEPRIAVKTALITRSDYRTRLTSGYVRAAMTKLQGQRHNKQQKLPLAV
jgi:DNA-binding transcriptional LysR family regulator